MKKTDSKGRHPVKVIFVVILAVSIILLYCIGTFAYVFAEIRNDVDIWCGGAAVYVDESNGFVWDYNGDTQYDLDSLTMLLTCLIANEKLDPAEEVTVTGSAIYPDDPGLWLKEGEVTTVDALMHLALMTSDCTAARMLAILTAESEDEFVKLMNERALELGCTKSEFYSVTGRNNAGNYCSAKDICLITEAVLESDYLENILSEKSYSLPATNMNEARTLATSNLLLTGGTTKNLSGVDITIKEYAPVYAGMKSSTPGQKTVAVSAAKVDGITLIAAVLDGLQASEFGDICRMVAYSSKLLQPYKAVEKNTEFDKKAKVKNGAVGKVSGVTGEDGYVNLLEGASASLILVEPEFYEDLQAPISKGEVIGQAVIYLADVPVNSVDIVATEEVKEGWIFSRIGIPNSVALIIMTVLCLIIIAVIVLTTLVRKKKAEAKAKRQERIREIARKQLEQEQSARERDWPYRH